MKYKKETILSISSLTIFIVLFEIILRLINFAYYPLDIGFAITPEYRAFEKIDSFYETQKRKVEFRVFQKQKFPIQKKENEKRIFILGGSSVFALREAKELRMMLEKKLPGNNLISIINAGGNSYGSNRLLLHFHEILNYEPDLVILYSGHNEFEEAFMRETFFNEGPLSSLNASLLNNSRLYQFLHMLISDSLNLLFSKNVDAIKKGTHPFFPPDTILKWNKNFDKNRVYQNYKRNIMQMARIAKKNNINILLSTVAYNRLFKPFKEPEQSKLSFDYCLDLYAGKKYAKARACLEEVLDNDLQPHRASETSNAIIKEIARTCGVPFADVDRGVVEQAPHAIPGNEIFRDHCHLNDEGQTILMTVLYEAIINNTLLP